MLRIISLLPLLDQRWAKPSHFVTSILLPLDHPTKELPHILSYGREPALAATKWSHICEFSSKERKVAAVLSLTFSEHRPLLFLLFLFLFRVACELRER